MIFVILEVENTAMRARISTVIVHCPILLHINSRIYQGSQALGPTQAQF